MTAVKRCLRASSAFFSAAGVMLLAIASASMTKPVSSRSWLGLANGWRSVFRGFRPRELEVARELEAPRMRPLGLLGILRILKGLSLSSLMMMPSSLLSFSPLSLLSALSPSSVETSSWSVIRLEECEAFPAGV